MGASKGNESWLSSLWRISWKAFEPEKAVIGILAFEVASLMSKVVKLWQGLSDLEIHRLREEILNSVGIRNLVSENDDFLMNLALDEIVGNSVYVAKSVVRLGNRCTDPVYHRLGDFFIDPVKNFVEWSGWEYRGKKMERKVKKMEKFVVLMLQLTQEEEVLAELEQTLRRMKANPLSDKLKLYEFQQKVLWQRQEVRNIRDLSPWNRSYDYIVRLLTRSIFTILVRITSVFGIKRNDSGFVSSQLQSSVHPSDPILPLLHSGPLGSSSRTISNKKQRQTHHHRSFSVTEKRMNMKTKRLAHMGSLKGCMDVGTDFPIVQMTENSKDVRFLSESYFVYSVFAVSYSKHGWISAASHTLGSAALALHYANLVLLIEKLAASPHMVGLDARNDLYNLLPTSVRSALRARLKPFAAFPKVPTSLVYDPKLVWDWSTTIAQMLEWLAPLAQNTMKWHSEQSIEKQHVVSGSNVLLVQTLYFADRAKTEAAITELLMGLNYLCRVYGGDHRELVVVVEKK